MRWLFVKDLQILRRSPFLTALLVLYPIVLAVLIGFAISRAPDRPRVAFLNEIPSDEALQLGDGSFSQEQAFEELCSKIECVDVADRDEALRQVRDGQVLGALIVPPNFIERLQAQLGGVGVAPAAVEVYVNEDDPVKAQLVDDRINSLLTEANLILSQQISVTLLDYLDILVRGGTFDVPLLGETLDVLGLERSEQDLRSLRSRLPPGESRRVLDQVIEFAGLAGENLGFADELLTSVASPIAVQKEILAGDVPPLDTFAIATAIAVTLLFVTVLLVAGSLALEREENTFSRLARGLVGRTSLLIEKVGLGTVCSLAVALVLLVVLDLFVPIAWSRAYLFVPAIVLAGAAFAAMGAAIGVVAREVRTSALFAFALALPIAFLSLVPSGTVSPTLFDVIRAVTAIFPFRPALDAVSAGLAPDGPELAAQLAHMAALTVGYVLLARVGLRRFS